jgi:hypothetical protein
VIIACGTVRLQPAAALPGDYAEHQENAAAHQVEREYLTLSG